MKSTYSSTIFYTVDDDDDDDINDFELILAHSECIATFSPGLGRLASFFKIFCLSPAILKYHWIGQLKI